MSEPKPTSAQATAYDGPELLKIGDFARLAGTNLRTLRYYEELGLLAPASRSKGGFRYYRRSDVNRLEMIKSLQELGLQLERIRDLMATRQHLGDRHRFFSGVREALAEQDRLLDERIQGLEDQRGKIQSALGKISECDDCTHTPSPENNFCEPCQETERPLPADVSALF
jgi:DNA-binding transcriptional MerR regulator